MEQIIIGLIVLLGIIFIVKISYKNFIEYNTISLYSEYDMTSSKKIEDYIIFEYKKGGYMGLVSLSVPVLTRRYDIYSDKCKFYMGDLDRDTRDRLYYIAYEIKKDSDDFFIYGKMKADKGKLKFSTFLGNKACRFIIFTDEKISFVPDNKKIEIIEDNSSIDYIFKAMPWQKWGKRKRYEKIRIDEDNEIIPYEYIKKN